MYSFAYLSRDSLNLILRYLSYRDLLNFVQVERFTRDIMTPTYWLELLHLYVGLDYKITLLPEEAKKGFALSEQYIAKITYHDNQELVMSAMTKDNFRLKGFIIGSIMVKYLCKRLQYPVPKLEMFLPGFSQGDPALPYIILNGCLMTHQPDIKETLDSGKTITKLGSTWERLFLIIDSNQDIEESIRMVFTFINLDEPLFQRLSIVSQNLYRYI